MNQKNKNNFNGWLIIDKERGISSANVVNQIKRFLNCKKVGHAGTLDPDATGLLAVGLGEATKLMSYITDELKSYNFIIKFGIKTHSDDSTGKVILSSKKRPTNFDLLKTIPSFMGHIWQKPPIISAIKVKGQRAYKLYDNPSEEIELKKRKVFVKSLKMIERIDNDHASFEIVCGKGTYVRSIARDIGETLGCHAHTSLIRRIHSGPFKSSDMIKLSHLKINKPYAIKSIKPIEKAVPNLKKISCDEESHFKLKNGQKIKFNNKYIIQRDVLVTFNNKPIAVCTIKEDYIIPKRVFNLY